MPMKILDRACRVHPMILAAVDRVLVLAFNGHAAWAQLGPSAVSRAPVIGGFAGWVLAKQAVFYRALAGMIRAAKSDGTALWGLMGISFVYGIFHAAGPGHGKAVISSYLVANEETWRRGITLSFASAVMQSVTAIAIVAVAAVLLGGTAKLMGDTVRVIEICQLCLDRVAGRATAVGQRTGFHFNAPRPQGSIAKRKRNRAPRPIRSRRQREL